MLIWLIAVFLFFFAAEATVIDDIINQLIEQMRPVPVCDIYALTMKTASVYPIVQMGVPF